MYYIILTSQVWTFVEVLILFTIGEGKLARMDETSTCCTFSQNKRETVVILELHIFFFSKVHTIESSFLVLFCPLYVVAYWVFQ